MHVIDINNLSHKHFYYLAMFLRKIEFRSILYIDIALLAQFLTLDGS